MEFKCTAYFEQQVMRKRSYLKQEWCLEAITNPLQKMVQEDGRIRHWIYVKDMSKYLRVVTLADGTTVHNAFPDRDFKPEE